MRVASLLLALTAAPAVRAAPTGRTKHLHELEADLDELEKMHEYVLERSFDKTNPDVCSIRRSSCEDAIDYILHGVKEEDKLKRVQEITDDECAKYKTKDSGEYIVCRKAYFSIGCASQRLFKPKRFCKDLLGAQLGDAKREREKQIKLQKAEKGAMLRRNAPNLFEYVNNRIP
jgi:hypothetical protein